MTDLPVQRLLLDAVAVVESARLPYMVLGGFAVRAWAIPRPTFDADVAVEADDAQLAGLLRMLAANGFDVPAEHRDGFQDSVAGMPKVRVSRFADGRVWEVDVFLVRTPLLRSALARRRAVEIGGRPVQVMAPEDVILLKLVANRPRDVADIDDLLLLAAPLDLAYVRAWADRIAVRDRLEARIAGVGGGPPPAGSHPATA